MTPRPPQEWEIALQAQNEIYSFAHSWEGIEYMKTWLHERLNQYGIGAMNPSEVALRVSDVDLRECEPLYVVDEMQRLVYSAMETFDRTEQVHEDDFFLKSGFAYLAEPFCSLDDNGNKVCWRAVQWVYDEMWTATGADYLNPQNRERLDRLILNAQRHGKIEGQVVKADFKISEMDKEDKELFENLKFEAVVRIILWSHIDDDDDYPLTPDEREYYKARGDVWGIAHATALPIREISHMAEIKGEGDTTGAWLTFLRVMNRLMAEKIVVRSHQQAPRALRRAAQRAGNPREGVIVVELRRRSYSAKEPSGEHRAYSHRFIRHWHWRRQWYPSLKTHRQKFIADMIIGPEDKPLIIKDRVWVWKK